MEDRFAKLSEYQLRELQRTYYYQWRDLKRDISFFATEEDDTEMYRKISELKKKYFEIKAYLQEKPESKIVYVEKPTPRVCYFF